jgi:hypothetical protein
VTDPGNKRDGGSRRLFSGEILLDLAPVMAHGGVHVHDRFFCVNSALGVRVFL